MSPLSRWLAIVCGILFAGILVFLSPGKLALALAVAIVGLIVMQRPRLGLLLFAFLALFMPYSTVTLGIRITVCEALLAFTWLGAAWHLFFGNLRWQIHATERRLIWLAVFSLLPFLAGQIMVHADGNGPVNWARWILNLSPLLLAPILLEDESSLDGLIVALLLGALAMLSLSIAYFVKDRNAVSFIPVLTWLRYAHPEAVTDIFSANYTRMASPWVHPNLTGGVLMLFLPLAFFYAQVRTGWRRRLGIAVAGLGAAGLLLSISRGAIVSLVLIMVWLTWRKAPLAGRIIGLATALAVTLVLFYPPLQERLGKTFSSTNESTQVRLNEYREFPRAMARYPLGIGFKADAPPDADLQGISNLWLNYIYKLGVLGLLLYLGVLAAWWKESRPKGWFDRLAGAEALAVGSSAGILAALLTGLFDHYYSFTVVLVALFWLVMGVNLRLVRGPRSQEVLPFPETKGNV
jgi:polysaccharide biosynthesis protein PslJ